MKGVPATSGLILLAGSLLLVLGVDEQVAPSARRIPRFQEVTENLYRGGLPTPAGFEFLKQKGIRTVINLRQEDDEKVVVEKLGMRYAHIPLSAWDRVPNEAIQTFFEVLTDQASQPAFVHCERGADRTGVMVGFYRIAFQGWDGQKAYAEARAMGMRWWYRGLKRQLYEFARNRALAPASPGRE